MPFLRLMSWSAYPAASGVIVVSPAVPLAACSGQDRFPGRHNQNDEQKHQNPAEDSLAQYTPRFVVTFNTATSAAPTNRTAKRPGSTCDNADKCPRPSYREETKSGLLYLLY